MTKWRKVKFGEIFDISSSKRVLQEDWKTSGVPFYRAREIVKLAKEGAVENELFISEELFDSFKSKYGVPKPGDLMISAVGTLGACYVVQLTDRFYYKDASVLRFSPKQEVCSKFIQHAFRTPEILDQIHAGSGSTVGTYTINRAIATRIGLPSFPEQIRIAAILDQADALRAKRREALAQLDNLTQSIFIEMFGNPVTNPMGWEVKKLKEISKSIVNGTTPKGGSQVYVSDGIVFFRSQNVWKNSLLLDDVAYIDNETHFKMRKSSLQNKDILITKTGRINTENSSLGRAAIFIGKDNSANINGHVYLIRLEKGSIHEFVLYILTTDEYREYIRSVCVGGIDKRQINKEHLEEFPIIFPPVGLQHRFATLVESIEKQKGFYRSQLAELDNLFTSIQHRAFRGEL